MSTGKILLTIQKDLATPLLKRKNIEKMPLLHLPLESYTFYQEPEESEQIRNQLEHFSFVIHGNLRNSRHFMNWTEKENRLQQVREIVNLTADEPTAAFLEEKGVPAILPGKDAKPIDVLEFLLRISREGKILYPTTDQKTEEIPGLLQELEMPVMEFTVCKETSIQPGLLEEYREIVNNTEIKAVLFHNRSSVVRITKAFPGLDLSSVQRIAASRGVQERLKEEGLETELQAHGSWASVAEALYDLM